MEAFESEDVKIDGWEIRLPSDICTNRQIFDEIFSIDTWNNVLTPEQRCRLTVRTNQKLCHNYIIRLNDIFYFA